MDREQARSPAAFAQDVHVWYAWTKACDDASRRAYYLSLLSEDETARMQRLAFDHLRFEFLLTRALCRTALSAHLGIPPQFLRFRSGPRGRPELAEQVAGPRLDFNLTNGSSLVACVIARGVEVGIDAERVSAFGDIDTIAQQSLSAREAASMDALAAPRRAERLCELWTLKESYLKARGIGLSVPPTFCGFELGAGDIKASFDPRLEDDPSRWQFRLSAPDPEHRLAVSVRHDGDLRLHIGCTVPGPPDQG